MGNKESMPDEYNLKEQAHILEDLKYQADNNEAAFQNFVDIKAEELDNVF